MAKQKRDFNHEANSYKNWKEQSIKEGIIGISKINSDLIIRFILDLEIGQNTAKDSKKGGRSFGRLLVLKNKLIQFIKILEGKGINDFTKVTEKDLHLISNELRTGVIRRIDGKTYECPVDFIRNFKALWHWWMKVNRKEGVLLIDICEDLEMQHNPTRFVYFTKEQLDEMLLEFKYDEKILCMFLFDSLVRFPSEAISLKVKDLYEKNGEMWVNVPIEVATKTGIGRTFNLMYCGDEVKRYIEENNLQPDDFLFKFIKDGNHVYKFNKKLKEIAVKTFGDVVSHPVAKEKFSNLSGYDFRHSGAIHFRILAQKHGNIALDSIRERGGWKNFDMLNYYTQFIGLSGEIKKDALLIEEDKSRLEKELQTERFAREKLEKDFKSLKKQFVLDFKKQVKEYLTEELNKKRQSQINTKEVK